MRLCENGHPILEDMRIEFLPPDCIPHCVFTERKVCTACIMLQNIKEHKRWHFWSKGKLRSKNRDLALKEVKDARN